VDRRRFRIWVAATVLIVLAGCSGRSDSASAFDGNRAYDLLKKQCAFGPRYSGTSAAKATAAFLEAQLKQYSEDVSAPIFTANIAGKSLEFQNIYAIINPNARHFVLLCAHWDTRPMADQEIDPVKRAKPILGANDGASGVAVLLELARVFNADKPKVGVVIALFDGEDYGKDDATMFIGAREFARHWKTLVKPGGREISYDYGILLDMVGDKDLTIPKEQLSVKGAPAVVDKVWSAAKRSGHGDVFLNETRYGVTDDHLPLQAAGIKCIDVIDFDYAPWHTLDDTPDKCSAKSLKTVGDVVAKVIYQEGS
jgi:glutaminyl-peptide cyclotransferase